MNEYIILNQAFCQTNHNYKNDSGMFGYRQTIAGDYVCAVQTLTDFPELFTGEIELPGINIVELEISDFYNEKPS